MADIVGVDDGKIFWEKDTKMIIENVSNKNQINTVEMLAYEIWHEHYSPIIGTSQVQYMLKKFQSVEAISEQIKNGYLYFLSVHDNEPMGYMSMNISGKELFLSKFYVVSSQRGKGYGRKMITFIEELSKGKKLNKILLTVNRNNTDSIKMYEAVGFIKCGTVIKDIANGFVMDDYKMEKEL